MPRHERSYRLPGFPCLAGKDLPRKINEVYNVIEAIHLKLPPSIPCDVNISMDHTILDLANPPPFLLEGAHGFHPCD